ncbi:MAG: hypothetical protein AAB646_01355 [Patescibacteria group bacterium]
MADFLEWTLIPWIVIVFYFSSLIIIFTKLGTKRKWNLAIFGGAALLSLLQFYVGYARSSSIDYLMSLIWLGTALAFVFRGQFVRRYFRLQ